MAICANSTTAPARPLLPLAALDRRAIGRDGWARARELAARLGGEIRDHVAEGMRQAWAAARGLLQAAASASAPSDASALASESVAAARPFKPAQSRSVDQVGGSDLVPSYPDHIGVVPPLLPIPVPLPSLTAALSRRRAIFGAVAVDEPDTAAEARTLHLRRQLEAAAEHGAAMLAALNLPRLVYPDFVGVDPMAAGDALDRAIAALDALDEDPDFEDGADDEFPGDDELSLGWTAKVDQVHLGQDQDDHEVTALERYGLGFFRSGPDDAEDDDPAEHDFRSHGPASTLRPLVAHA